MTNLNYRTEPDEKNRVPELTMIKSLITLTKPQTIVEIGVNRGSASIYLCEAANEIGGKVFLFDIWEDYSGPTWNKKVRVASSPVEVGNRLAEYAKLVTITQTDTSDPGFPELLKSMCPTIDFAFIDGDHRYEGVKRDFYSVKPLLSDNAIVILHDTYQVDGCRKFAIELRTNEKGFDIIELPYGWGNKTSPRCGHLIAIKRGPSKLDVTNIYDEQSDIEDTYAKEKEFFGYKK